jgi:putative hemolysin
MQSTNTFQSTQPNPAHMRFEQPQSLNKPIESKLIACFSQDPKEIRRAQLLRARVFNLFDNDVALDKDKFDDICLHLLVKDSLSNNIVGYSRILTSDLVSNPSEFYSASEFDLSQIIKPNQRYMEIGRTCVDPNFRSGAVIGMLWSKIGQFMNEEKIDHLMGCASISMFDGGAKALAVVNHLREKHFSAEHLRVVPKIPLPQFDIAIEGKEHVPALLKTYLRMGAKVCGEAYLDRDFNVADVLILLAKQDIAPRYLRHFS